jgi:hypothetical protein
MRTDGTDSISVVTVQFGTKIGSPNSDKLRMSLRPAIRRGFQITSKVCVLRTFGTNHLICGQRPRENRVRSGVPVALVSSVPRTAVTMSRALKSNLFNNDGRIST